MRWCTSNYENPNNDEIAPLSCFSRDFWGNRKVWIKLQQQNVYKLRRESLSLQIY